MSTDDVDSGELHTPSIVKRPAYWHSVTEVIGDLLSCPPEYSIAHCISSDAVMGRGIAVSLCRKFPTNRTQIESHGLPLELHTVHPASIGTEASPRFLFNMVTKPKYYNKPTLYDMKQTLGVLVQACQQSGVHYLAMPRIGCGLDKLSWVDVLRCIREAFYQASVTVVVYSQGMK